LFLYYFLWAFLSNLLAITFTAANMMLNRLEEYFRYIPSSPRDRQWGLYVTGAGYQPVLPQAPYPPIGHPSTHYFAWERGRVLDQFGIIYLVRGKGEFESEATGKRQLEKGDVLFLFPEMWHRYRPVHNVGWEVYWVHFQGEDAWRLKNRNFITPKEPICRIGLNDAVLDLFVRLLDWLHAEPVHFQQIIAANTLQIIANTQGAVSNQAIESRLHEQIRKAKALLEGNLQGLPQMDAVAAELEMSRAQFFRIFKEHVGLSPYQYHLELKFNRARQLLQNSDLSIKQIAQIIGFGSVYHFSKFFKNKTGVAPTHWKHQRRLRLSDE
jgi:AraC-like DNA-binding protein